MFLSKIILLSFYFLLIDSFQSVQKLLYRNNFKNVLGKYARRYPVYNKNHVSLQMSTVDEFYKVIEKN